MFHYKSRHYMMLLMQRTRVCVFFKDSTYGADGQAVGVGNNLDRSVGVARCFGREKTSPTWKRRRKYLPNTANETQSFVGGKSVPCDTFKQGRTFLLKLGYLANLQCVNFVITAHTKATRCTKIPYCLSRNTCEFTIWTFFEQTQVFNISTEFYTEYTAKPAFCVENTVENV